MPATRITRLLVIYMLAMWAPSQAGATTVLPVSLQKMSAAAATIFYGRVVANETRQDPASGQVATFTTFEVIDVIKGNPGSIHTIKQIGGQLPGSNRRLVIRGVPRFQQAEEYVVFLPKPSNLGFCSPIGLSQGKFDVRDQNGSKVVSNRRTINGLVGSRTTGKALKLPGAVQTGSPTITAVPGQASSARLDDFMQTVRGMAKE